MDSYPLSSSTIAATALSSLRADLLYLSTILTGVAAVCSILCVFATYVHFLNTALPSSDHRVSRLILGSPALLMSAFLSFHVFDRSTCAFGAAGAGSLATFNVPLRALQLLMTPPSAVPLTESCAHCDDAHCDDCDSKKNEEANPVRPLHISPLSFTVLLILIPACPLTSALSLRKQTRRRHSIMAATPTHGILKAIFFFLSSSALCHFYPNLLVPSNPFMPPAVFAFLLTLMTSGFASITAATFSILSGLPCGPAFSWPWFSPSLSSFWAWRWNAPMASALRGAIFDPMMFYCGSSAAVATLAVFGASGAAHAGICFYGGLEGVAHRWAAFFVVQGVGVLGERALFEKNGAAGRKRLFSLIFLALTVWALFIGPLLESKQLPLILDEVGTSARIVVNSAILLRAAAAG